MPRRLTHLVWKISLIFIQQKRCKISAYSLRPRRLKSEGFFRTQPVSQRPSRSRGVANLILERGALRSGACRGRRGGVFLPGSGHVPSAFKVMRPWLSKGKTVARTPRSAMGHGGVEQLPCAALAGGPGITYRGNLHRHYLRLGGVMTITVPCTYCGSEIPAGAIVCPVCKYHQVRWRNNLLFLAGLAGLFNSFRIRSCVHSGARGTGIQKFKLEGSRQRTPTPVVPRRRSFRYFCKPRRRPRLSKPHPRRIPRTRNFPTNSARYGKVAGNK